MKRLSVLMEVLKLCDGNKCLAGEVSGGLCVVRAQRDLVLRTVRANAPVEACARGPECPDSVRNTQ